jgi:hypothetical protein
MNEPVRFVEKLRHEREDPLELEWECSGLLQETQTKCRVKGPLDPARLVAPRLHARRSLTRLGRLFEVRVHRC